MIISDVPGEPRFRRIGLALLIGTGYFLTAQLSIQLFRLTGDVAAVWPPNGIVLAALLLSSMRCWPLFTLAAFCATVAVNLVHGDSLVAGLGFAAANTMECLLIAATLRYLQVEATILDSVRNVLLYVPVAILAAAMGASLGAAVVVGAYGGSYWAVWPGWWIADLLGLLIVTPLLTAWSPFPALRRLRWARIAELAVLLTGTLTIAFAAFGGVSLPPVIWPMSLFMTVPFQIWAAVRFNRRVSMAISPLVLLGGVVALRVSSEPIPVTESVAAALMLLQAVLALTAINAMTLVAAISASREAERSAQAAEARLRDAIDSMSDSFELYDPDDRLELYNDRSRELVPELANVYVAGAPYEEMIRHGVERGLFADAAGNEEAWIEERLRRHRGSAEAYELQLVDGRCLLVCERRTSEGGTVTIRSDITQMKQQQQIRLQELEQRRRRAEAERLADVLQESEQRYRHLVEFSPDPILVTRQGVIVFGNAAAVKAFGVAHPNELPGLSSLDFLHPDSRTAFREGGPQSQCGNEIAFVEAKYIRCDGTAFHGEASRTSIMWNGQPAEMIVVRDVTDRVRAETEKAALEARLRQSQKLESLGTLAGSTAHEFNNMLMPMMGFTELAIEAIPQNEQAQAYLSRVLASGQRAAQLVDRVLAFSRAEDAELKPLDLSAAVGEAVSLLKSTFPATIEIEASLDEVGQLVLADDTQIQLLVVNLATNAMHAMEGKVGKLIIELSEAELYETRASGATEVRPGKYAKLRMQDTGRGMDHATFDRIFEPFFTSKDVGQGTGLGLAIVHGIVTAHGGLVEVESMPGRGTTFTLYLPHMEEDEAVIPAMAG